MQNDQERLLAKIEEYRTKLEEWRAELNDMKNDSSGGMDVNRMREFAVLLKDLFQGGLSRLGGYKFGFSQVLDYVMSDKTKLNDWQIVGLKFLEIPLEIIKLCIEFMKLAVDLYLQDPMFLQYSDEVRRTDHQYLMQGLEKMFVFVDTMKYILDSAWLKFSTLAKHEDVEWVEIYHFVDVERIVHFVKTMGQAPEMEDMKWIMQNRSFFKSISMGSLLHHILHKVIYLEVEGMEEWSL